MSDMTKDYFADFPAGKIALRRMSPVGENFRLYELEITEDQNVMKVTGADFRHAKSGKYKGVLSIMVPGTKKVTYIHSDEVRNFKP